MSVVIFDGNEMGKTVPETCKAKKEGWDNAGCTLGNIIDRVAI